jgi:hypothetical protein
MQTLSSTWIIVIIITITIAVTLGSLIIKSRTARLVDPNKLPVPRGAYGVVHSVNPVQPIIGCEPSGTGISNKFQACTFSGVTSLNAAMQLCDVHVKICDGFIYSPNTKIVNLVDTRQQLKTNTTSNTGWDAYVRQYPKSFT